MSMFGRTHRFIDALTIFSGILDDPKVNEVLVFLIVATEGEAGISRVQIVGRMDISQATVSRMASRLTRVGLFLEARAPGDHGREKRLKLSPLGHTLFESMME